MSDFDGGDNYDLMPSNSAKSDYDMYTNRSDTTVGMQENGDAWSAELNRQIAEINNSITSDTSGSGTSSVEDSAPSLSDYREDENTGINLRDGSNPLAAAQAKPESVTEWIKSLWKTDNKEDAFFRNALALKLIGSVTDSQGRELKSAQAANYRANTDATRTSTEIAKTKQINDAAQREAAMKMLQGVNNGGLINAQYRPLNVAPVQNRIGG